MESILSIVFLILLAQAPEAAIEGVVVRAGTSEPLSKATVELRRAEGNGTHSYVTTTGSDGRFFLRNVQPGQYRLVATRDAYVRAEYGQRGPNAAGSPISKGRPADEKRTDGHDANRDDLRPRIRSRRTAGS